MTDHWVPIATGTRIEMVLSWATKSAVGIDALALGIERNHRDAKQPYIYHLLYRLSLRSKGNP